MRRKSQGLSRSNQYLPTILNVLLPYQDTETNKQRSVVVQCCPRVMIEIPQVRIQ